ncbi:hypothetical protein PR003_g27169 [Phytophthora rubi]|uniref:Uncharacterized protein n=1 Tax=Phytophthora rubi TaxID=129364 RepID=A0A6A4C4S7_9STRA|nr:hypothetical protein PR003_g27169 [Phytophthora rubi]
MRRLGARGVLWGPCLSIHPSVSSWHLTSVPCQSKSLSRYRCRTNPRCSLVFLLHNSKKLLTSPPRLDIHPGRPWGVTQG